MQWKELSATDFEQAVKDTGVCILPTGVLEKHSEHLPLGTDCYISHGIANLAAEKESAVVFPPFYFGQIYEARCFPGTITIPPRLLLDLFMATLDEIERNGFKKIIIVNGHGGNNSLLPFLAQCALWEEKPYHIYIPRQTMSDQGQKEWDSLVEAPYGGHAGEYETALILGLHPELVHMDRLPEEPAQPLGRMGKMDATYNAIWWYADYPDHYAGDGSKGTVEKGRKLVELTTDYLASYIADVKKDEVIPALTREFFEHTNSIGK